jgi:hypothetical protein
VTYTIAPDGLSITCHACGLTSHNLNDVEQRFCGACMVFHDDASRSYASPLAVPLRRVVLIAARAASKLFEARGRISAPIWAAYKSDGQELLIPQLVGDRDAQLILLRVLFEIEHVVRYTVVGEAWYAMLVDVKWDGVPPPGTATNHPNGIEILHVHGEDIREGCFVGHRKITRDKKGRPKLGPLTIGRPDRHEGAMFDLLPRSKSEKVH